MTLASLRPLATLLMLAMLPAAPPRAPFEVVARDPGARVERIADGVYAIVHDDAVHDWPSGATDWPHGNTGASYLVWFGSDADRRTVGCWPPQSIGRARATFRWRFPTPSAS